MKTDPFLELVKCKAEKREFAAQKKAGLLTPEEQAADKERKAKHLAWQKQWREKKKADEAERMMDGLIHNLVI